VAVIDIGSTFIRLTIAEKRGERGVRVLERAVQSVAIGRDVVKERRISNATIEQCVSILQSFAVLLKEYGIRPEAVQAVANAAVRQADNRDAFIDRLSIASRIPFRMIDPGQIGYYYHLALRVIRNKQSGWEKGNVAVTEIGGLTCSLLFRKEGEIRFAQTYGIGSLRLLQQMEQAGLGPSQLEELAEGRTREVAIHLRQNIGADEPLRLLFMGREMRYAAARLHAKEKASSTAAIVTRLSVSALERLVGQVVRESVEAEIRGKQEARPQQRAPQRQQPAPARRTQGDGASPRQLQYLQDLANSAGVDLNNELRRLNLGRLDDLTRQQCSGLIDDIRGSARAA